MRPLEGYIVLDFAQYLAAPWAATKMADLGARVIKIESPKGGDNSRRLTLCNLVVDGDSTVFHSMNRNKESYTANLKDPEDLARVKKLIERSDVMIHNFRPGVMERLGLDYATVKTINPGMVYASITGYGADGPLVKKPGQDLLVQSMTAIPWLSGNSDGDPTPIGVAAIDMYTSMQVIEGILACLLRRVKTGEGALVEASLLESSIDFQFEVFTTYFNDGGNVQERSRVSNAHPYLPAPYGIYKTADGFLALAMGSILVLADLLECDALLQYEDVGGWFDRRDEIKTVLTKHLATRTTQQWLDKLEPADYWAAKVNTIADVVNDPELNHCDMFQEVVRKNGVTLKTTRSPLRIDGEKLFASKGAPVLGEDTEAINTEFNL